MSDAEMMLRALRSGDTSDATIYAALDALREEGSLTALGIVRQIFHVVEEGQNERECEAARILIEPGQPMRERLLRDMRARSGVSMGATVAYAVHEGKEEPVAFTLARGLAEELGCDWQIDVGARWLIERAEELREYDRETARRAP